MEPDAEQSAIVYLERRDPDKRMARFYCLHRPRRPSAPLSGVDQASRPAIVLSRANLDAQGGLVFLSVGRHP